MKLNKVRDDNIKRDDTPLLRVEGVVVSFYVLEKNGFYARKMLILSYIGG